MTSKPPRGQHGLGYRTRLVTGGRIDVGKGSRHRHADLGTEMSGGSWQVAGFGNVQVDSTPHRERRWVAGVTEMCGDSKRLLMGGAVGQRKYQERSRNG